MSIRYAPPKVLIVGVPIAKYDSLSFDTDSCLTESGTLFGRAVGKCGTNVTRKKIIFVLKIYALPVQLCHNP